MCEQDKTSINTAYRIILLLGIVALCGDIIYEGARSISGPYLFSLGASAVLVGTITGVGEFLGYAVRILSGKFVDSTRRYWLFAIGGYALLSQFLSLHSPAHGSLQPFSSSSSG